MSFQLKNFKSIVASMINYSKATQDTLTDFHVGSVARTLFEAPAIEIDQYYQQVFYGLLDAIPVAVYNAFGFERLQSACASGMVRFYGTAGRTGNVTIYKGTVLTKTNNGDVRYFVNADTVLKPTDSYVDVRVTAEKTGIDGNASIGEVTEVNVSFGGIDHVSNVSIISGGRVQETEQEQKLRFQEYIQSISNGTVKAVTYGASTAVVRSSDGIVTEYVTKVGINEGVGEFTLYIYGSGGEPSDELISNAQKIIDGGYNTDTGQYDVGFRGAGVSGSVMRMTEHAVDFDLAVQVYDDEYKTDDMKNTIKSVLSILLSQVNPSKRLTVAEIRAELLNIVGVDKIVINMDSNIECEPNNVLVLGNTEIAWL